MGVRVIAGERTGYAYSDDLSPEKIRKAARVAARIATGPASIVKTGFEEARKHNLYPMLQRSARNRAWRSASIWSSAPMRAARAYDSRVFQVQATYADSVREVLVATSEGRLELRPAADGAHERDGAGARRRTALPQHGYSGGGGRVTLDFFLNEKTPEHFAREAARQAIVQLGAVDAPGRRDDGGAGSGLAGHPAA